MSENKIGGIKSQLKSYKEKVCFGTSCATCSKRRRINKEDWCPVMQIEVKISDIENNLPTKSIFSL